jgi:hypothetical protein
MAGDRPREEIGRLFAGFTAYSEPFRSMVTELGGARSGRGTTTTTAEPTPRGGAR